MQFLFSFRCSSNLQQTVGDGHAGLYSVSARFGSCCAWLLSGGKHPEVDKIQIKGSASSVFQAFEDDHRFVFLKHWSTCTHFHAWGRSNRLKSNCNSAHTLNHSTLKARPQKLKARPKLPELKSKAPFDLTHCQDTCAPSCPRLTGAKGSGGLGSN